MSRTVSSLLAEAESQVQAGLYKEAIELLKDADRTALDSCTSAHFDLLMGEAQLLVGNHNVDHIDRAIDYFRSTTEHGKFAQAKYLKGLQLQLQGQFAQAREAMIEAFAGFLRVQDTGKAARAQNRLAHIAHLQGDSEQAIENLKKSAERYIEIGDNVNANNARGNLALMYWRCGSLSTSLAIYDEIVPIADGMWPQSRVALLLGHCGAIARSGDLKTACAKITKLETDTRGFAREHGIAFEYSGWIHLLAGKHKQAEAALSKGLKLAMESAPQSALISQIKRLFGDLYIATGKYDLAETYAREGLAVAEKLTERMEIAACHRVFAQVEQARGNGDKARHWYGQAIDMFSRIGARYELATTRLLAGSTGLYGGGDRVAMLHLAKEYFESENLTHLIKQVDRQLAQSAPAVIVPRAAEGAPVIVAVSPVMRKLLDFARHIAPCRMTVLLTGETGAGKDMLARYIHDASGRSGPFVPVNAAAIPATMIEAELFGHSRGAFTGAINAREGLFEQAHDGTFYLNEIADAPAEFQAKLLDVLETRTVRRLGDNKSRTVDFRLIAATNHDIQACIKSNSFRLDLFHRLNEVPILLPPLSARLEDVAPLVAHFLTQIGMTGLSAEDASIARLASALSGRAWPGNVRQLRATVNHLHALCAGDLALMIDMAQDEQTQSDHDHFQQVLISTGWNRSRTAEILGVSEGTVRHRIKKYELSEPVGSSPSYQ